VDGKEHEERTKRAFEGVLLEMLRLRKSLVRLYLLALQNRRKIKELEKRIESFVRPS